MTAPEISPLPVFGPYELESQALAALLPVRCRDAQGDNLAHSRRMLKRVHIEQMCRDLGVPLGAYDMRVLTWLTDFAEPTVIQFILGLLSRAHASGRGELPRAGAGQRPCPIGDPWCGHGDQCPTCETAQPGYGRPAMLVEPGDLAPHEAGE